MLKSAVQLCIAPASGILIQSIAGQFEYFSIDPQNQWSLQ